MLGYYDVYKNLSRNGSNGCNAAYRLYGHFKRLYRSELEKAKREACEEFIENSSNKCKAAWNIISQKHTPFRSSHIKIDPEHLNSYFLHCAQDLKNQIPKPTGNTHINSLTDAESVIPAFNWTTVTPHQVLKVVSHLSN